MQKTREILRMKWDVMLSNRRVAEAVGVSAGAVSTVLSRARDAGLDWETVSVLTEEALEERLYGPRSETRDLERPLPDFAEIHAERSHPGVTLALLHHEYLQEHADGYGYTQFCEYYRRWVDRRGLSMRQVHKAADKMFVDYSGKKPSIVDPKTGQRHEVELFVAVLGASNHTYAEATLTQRVPDFIGSHVRAFRFFGGVTAAVVPDQLKSAVTRACKYEPGLQRTYEDMAEHYGTAVVPARPGKPKDKAKVETAVLVAQRWILARLRKQTFFSLEEVNERIQELLEELAERKMRRYGMSRRERFERTDQRALRPLPAESYELADWSKATVGSDYHVTVDDHAYSVPHRYVGDQVEMRATATMVEVLRRGQRIAVHARSTERHGKTTSPEHMPVAHRKHLEWTPERILHCASKVGPHTHRLASAILEDRPHPEQGYRSCLGLLGLEKPYGAERLERASRRALAAGARSYTNVQSILRAGLDKLEPETEREHAAKTHENIRGSDYYAGTSGVRPC